MEGEQVLVFPARELDRLGRFQGFTTDPRYARLLEAGFFLERARAEQDPAYKQIIPYCVLRWGDRFFRYRRTGGGGEARLHHLYSIGVGGHVNPPDSAGPLARVVETAAEREVHEELVVATPYRLQPMGFLNDDANAVGAVHFGVVFRLDLERPAVTVREHRTITEGCFLPPPALLAELAAHETWSQFLIRALVSCPVDDRSVRSGA